jgi:hypothetical protein
VSKPRSAKTLPLDLVVFFFMIEKNLVGQTPYALPHATCGGRSTPNITLSCAPLCRPSA